MLAFFQAMKVATDDEVTRRVIAQLPDDVVDLSGALDDAPSTFIDGVHTNEEGSRRVAAALAAQARGTVLEPAGS